jgi:hypothetical protein
MFTSKVSFKQLAVILLATDPEMYRGYVEDLNSHDPAQIGEYFASCDPEFARELVA